MTLARQLIGDAFIDQIDVKIHRQHQRKHKSRAYQQNKCQAAGWLSFKRF